MTEKESYSHLLKQEFTELFDTLDLDKRQKRFLQSRWMDQVLWMDSKATECRNRYYQFRLTAIVLGVIVPILVGISPADKNQQQFLKALTIGFSGMVAVSAAVEEFFHYGDRWYHYRRTVESLKSQGWQYFQLSGFYQAYQNHDQAFSVFVSQIEEIIQRDVEVYVTQVIKQADTTKDSKEQMDEKGTAPVTEVVSIDLGTNHKS